eukprot:TRINITY_DN80630_c0_g1_i1.p1 TRINITY_DN80630_c0_g1~~TRINITY_DN80630_c0_g1_i1.p1  ORF type:complete len:246 (-),score=33.01 TRINITY_DN80630_c0_g1_i1:246-983(-)
MRPTDNNFSSVESASQPSESDGGEFWQRHILWQSAACAPEELDFRRQVEDLEVGQASPSSQTAKRENHRRGLRLLHVIVGFAASTVALFLVCREAHFGAVRGSLLGACWLLANLCAAAEVIQLACENGAASSMRRPGWLASCAIVSASFAAFVGCCYAEGLSASSPHYVLLANQELATRSCLLLLTVRFAVAGIWLRLFGVWRLAAKAVRRVPKRSEPRVVLDTDLRLDEALAGEAGAQSPSAVA